jgi:hypothetical protein
LSERRRSEKTNVTAKIVHAYKVFEGLPNLPDTFSTTFNISIVPRFGDHQDITSLLVLNSLLLTGKF